MKRKCVLSTFILLLLFCGCASRTAQSDRLTSPSGYETCRTMEEFSLTVAGEPAVEDGLLTFFLANQGEDPLIYGYDFHLEQQLDGTWWTISLLSTVDGVIIEAPAIAAELAPGDAHRFALNLSDYGLEALEPGTYRVLIPITLVEAGVEQAGQLEVPIRL